MEPSKEVKVDGASINLGNLKMEEGVDNVKSYAFALNTVKVRRLIMEGQKEFVLSKKLLRSGISIGANVTEAQGGQSIKDFISKFAIAY